jgi:hypothetical protein
LESSFAGLGTCVHCAFLVHKLKRGKLEAAHVDLQLCHKNQLESIAELVT